MTRIAAHRGGAALWPENSLLAFQSAIALGSDLLEFDVHLTRDRTVAVIHDATLGRTTNGTGPVSSLTAADLRRLRLRGPGADLTAEPVPMLDDVLAAVTAAPRPVGLLVEVKESATGARHGVRLRLSVVCTVSRNGPELNGLAAARAAVFARKLMR